MLDMGFKPQVERIVARLPRDRQTMLFSATLDGEVGELARAYTSNPSRFEASPAERRRAGRGRRTRSSRSRPTASSTADRGARGRARPRARLRPHEARRRPARRRSSTRRDVAALALHGDMSQGAARAGARALPRRQGEDARRHRRRRPRPRPDGHHARDQLRSARGRQGLRPPRRPHRARRPRRHRDHLRPARAAGGRQPGRGAARPRRAVRARGHAPSPGAKRVYTSRRGRRSRW